MCNICRSCVLVFKLPMRDGNKATALYGKESGQVFKLPMRDGNDLKRRSSNSVTDVFKLPMRDGNTHGYI